MTRVYGIFIKSKVYPFHVTENYAWDKQNWMQLPLDKFYEQKARIA